MGELLSPLPAARLSERCLNCLSGEATVRLSGGCLPLEAPGGATRVVAASSPALQSAPAVTWELSVCRGLETPGRGHSSAQLVAGASLLSLALAASTCQRRRPDTGLCPRRPGLPGLCCWNPAPATQPPSRGAAAGAPPSYSPV